MHEKDSPMKIPTLHDLKVALQSAVKHSGRTQSGAANAIGYSESLTSKYLKVGSDKDVESIRLVQLLAAFGYDLLQWLDRESRPNSPYLEKWLDLQAHPLTPDEMELLRFLDRHGAFQKHTPGQISAKYKKILATADLRLRTPAENETTPK